MGILPGGTGNGLAGDLGIPGDLEAAAQLIASQTYELRSVDVGRVGDKLFVLRVTMGFETSVVQDATRELKDKFGWLAYAFAGLKTLTDPPKAMYRVEVDGVSHEAEGLACIVGELRQHRRNGHEALRPSGRCRRKARRHHCRVR